MNLGERVLEIYREGFICGGEEKKGDREGTRGRENHKEATRNNCSSTEDLGQQREVQLVITLLGVLYIRTFGTNE